jgi:hypothetical protein
MRSLHFDGSPDAADHVRDERATVVAPATAMTSDGLKP